MKPRFTVEQKITAFVNQYAVYRTDSKGNKADLAAFAQQKRLAFKEKVLFYSDEQKTTELFSFRAEKVMDVHGRFLVEQPDGTLIGAFQKAFGKSLLSSTWNMLENDQPKLTVTESSRVLAAARRFVGFIPVVGDIFEIILAFIKYHFVFIDPATNQIVGRYQKTTLFRDHYLLSMTDEAVGLFDESVFIAMAVALDALQSR